MSQFISIVREPREDLILEKLVEFFALRSTFFEFSEGATKVLFFVMSKFSSNHVTTTYPICPPPNFIFAVWCSWKLEMKWEKFFLQTSDHGCYTKTALVCCCPLVCKVWVMACCSRTSFSPITTICCEVWLIKVHKMFRNSIKKLNVSEPKFWYVFYWWQFPLSQWTEDNNVTVSIVP